MASATGRAPLHDEHTPLLGGMPSEQAAGLRQRFASTVRSLKDAAISKPKKVRPDPRTAAVRRENQRLTSEATVVQSLIRYAEAEDPDCFNHVSPNADTRLGVSTGDFAAQRAELDKMFNSGSAKLLIGVLQRVMEEGSGALGPNQRAHELFDEIGRGLLITGDEELAKPIRTKLEGDRETRIQLAAASLHELERHKVFGLDTLAFAGASVGAVPLVDDHINAPMFDPLKALILRSQKDPSRVSTGAKVCLALIESARAFLPETVDSTLVAKLNDLAEGGSLVPTAEDVRKGVKGGSIATAGSLMTNLLEQFPTGVPPLDIALKVVAYQVGTFACGAVVPMDLASTRAEMTQAWVESIRDGNQAPLKAPAHLEGATAGRAAVNEVVDRTMAVRPATEVMQKQLFWTFVAGLIPAGNEFVWKIPAESRKKIERTVENPVEVEAYNASVLTDLLVGLPYDLITTDARKSELLLAKVLQCRAEDRPLSKAEYERIFHPPLEVAGPVGRVFERGLNRLSRVAAASARMLGLARAPADEPIDFAVAVEAADHEAPTPSGRNQPDEMV